MHVSIYQSNSEFYARFLFGRDLFDPYQINVFIFLVIWAVANFSHMMAAVNENDSGHSVRTIKSNFADDQEL